METRRRNRGASRIVVATAIALGSTFVAAPVARAAEDNCDKTPVHKLICQAVDPGPIERVKNALCAASQELCL